MVKIAYANILLKSHPDNIVRSGSTVHGSLEFAYQEPEKIRGIRVEIIGVTKTHWVETESYSTGDSTVTVVIPYGYNHYHVKTSILLWGSPPTASRDDVREAPTTHTVLPFIFDLPLNLPESFEGNEYGFTRYYVKAIFDRPWKFDDEGRTIFTIVKDVDLNNMALLLKEPENLTKETCFKKSVRLRCCCTPLLCNGRFHYELSVAKLGYVSGECIVVHGKVRNKTGRRLKNLSIRLTQIVTFYGQRHVSTVGVGEKLNRRFAHSRIEVKKIVKLPVQSGQDMSKGKEVVVGSSALDSSILLLVPSIPTTRVDDTTPITISYALEITTKSEGCIRLRKNITPILIGNIPLMNLPMFFPGVQALLATPVVAFEPPPPNYQEAMSNRQGGHTNPIEVSDGNQPMSSSDNFEAAPVYFNPKYVYYNPISL